MNALDIFLMILLGIAGCIALILMMIYNVVVTALVIVSALIAEIADWVKELAWRRT